MGTSKCICKISRFSRKNVYIYEKKLSRTFLNFLETFYTFKLSGTFFRVFKNFPHHIMTVQSYRQVFKKMSFCQNLDLKKMQFLNATQNFPDCKNFPNSPVYKTFLFLKVYKHLLQSLFSPSSSQLTTNWWQ